VALTDEELDGLFDAHCYTDDFGTHLMDAACFRDGARAALAEPEPQGPTDEELRDLWSWAAGQDQGPWPTQQHCFVHAVLARWGLQPLLKNNDD